MIQARLVRWLKDQLHSAPWNKEKDFLLLQLSQLSEDGSWWSDEEWEWFLNRCLDFLGAPK